MELVAQAIKSELVKRGLAYENDDVPDWVWIRLARVAIEAIKQGGEWQPIETAPRDGTKFLGITASDRMKVDWFDASLLTSSFAHERGDNSYTHWMPLPNPPARETYYFYAPPDGPIEDWSHKLK